MSLKLTILGCGSATPTIDRNPTAQALQVLERFFLIDCGEGTQLQLRRNKIRPRHFDHIFISHLHGDHYLGLFGLLSSLHLYSRSKPMHVFCPSPLKEIIELQLKASDTRLTYELYFHELQGNEEQLIVETNEALVYSFPMNHRIPCWGFKFVEKPRPRSMKGEKIREYNIPFSKIDEIRNGKDFITETGRIIQNEELTFPAKVARTYAFCSDTIYDEQIISYVRNVDLLYHEATFAHDLLDKAINRYHSTALQAAQIAVKAEVKKLIIGHYSSRYGDITALLNEARTVFQNTIAASDNLVIEIS
ncbi:MAG: Ribonuclease Z [Bacteroidia bacterium]|nr:Ribonuclease Z [Bacteroidia bacterium]